jgi:hypothetical protein
LKDDLRDARIPITLPLVGDDGHTVQTNLARRTFVETNDASTQRGLSTAGLANQSNGLTTRDREVDTIDGSDRFGRLTTNDRERGASQRKMHLQSAYLKNGRC